MKYKQLDEYITQKKLTDIIIKIDDYNNYRIIENNTNKILVVLWILKFNNIEYPMLITEHSIFNNIIETYLHNFNYNIDDTWISASKTRNYLLNDPLIDFLEYKNKTTKKRKYNENKEETFLTTILDNGIEFEKNIMNKLFNKFPDEIITVGNHTTCRNPIYYKLTIDLIKNNVPIIYQGVLHNLEDKTFGIPDLIVRGDYINKIFDTKIDFENEMAYYIIDIKNSQLHLSAKSDNILNNSSIKPYKGQLAIYHKILSKIQGFDTGFAYILCNRWTRTNNYIVSTNNNPFDRLGIIDYKENDLQYIELVDNAIKWHKELRDNTELNHLEPNHINLYPNMCVDTEPKYKKLKSELAKKNSEITSLWMCGIKHRENALKHGIDKWTDKKLNSKILGINGQNGKILDLILKVNNSKETLIYPKKIKYNLNNWIDRDVLSFYIDFESINTVVFNGISNEIIFMIGVGYSINNEWFYKCLLINDLSETEQKRIIIEMIKCIRDISSINKLDYQNVNVYHWSNFEPSILSKACSKFNIMYPILKWTDILEIFHKEPIIIKGALNFSLKTVGKAMYELGMIKTIWKESKIVDGLAAMFEAYKIYLSLVDVNKNKQMKEIITYNHIDCKIMWDILNALVHYI